MKLLLTVTFAAVSVGMAFAIPPTQGGPDGGGGGGDEPPETWTACLPNGGCTSRIVRYVGGGCAILKCESGPADFRVCVIVASEAQPCPVSDIPDGGNKPLCTNCEYFTCDFGPSNEDPCDCDQANVDAENGDNGTPYDDVQIEQTC